MDFSRASRTLQQQHYQQRHHHPSRNASSLSSSSSPSRNYHSSNRNTSYDNYETPYRYNHYDKGQQQQHHHHQRDIQVDPYHSRRNERVEEPGMMDRVFKNGYGNESDRGGIGGRRDYDVSPSRNYYEDHHENDNYEDNGRRNSSRRTEYDRYRVNGYNHDYQPQSGSYQYNRDSGDSTSHGRNNPFHDHHHDNDIDYGYDRPLYYPDSPVQPRDYYKDHDQGYDGYRRGGRVDVSLESPGLIGTERSSSHETDDDGWQMMPSTETPVEDQNDDDDDDDDMNKKPPARTKSSKDFFEKWNIKDGKSEDSKKCMTERGPRKTIEVSPGVHVPVRGADETWDAVMADFYMPVECIGCESTVFCIQDAQYVLCPVCRIISPMQSYPDDVAQHVLDDCGVGGVGLGFTMEELAGWQDKVAYERRVSTKNNHYQ